MMLVKTMISSFALSLMLFSCSGDTETTTTTASSLSRTTTPKRFLFDATKAQTAGNADWVICENTSGTPIRFPNPLQNTVTATTPENY